VPEENQGTSLHSLLLLW